MTAPLVHVLTTDELVLRNLTRLAAEIGLDLAIAPEPGVIPTAGPTAGPAPLAVVLDLEADGAHELITLAKSRWPRTLVAGFVTSPAGEAWRSAEAAGCDVVATRGSLRSRLRTRIPEWLASPGGRRLRLFPMADVAGRLGLLTRLDDTPLGPIAVYHIGGDLLAIDDVCPHAGATLSGGDLALDEAVVTCPRHGSRFDVRTGERRRGPADEPVRAHRVVVDGAHAYLQVE